MLDRLAASTDGLEDNSLEESLRPVELSLFVVESSSSMDVSGVNSAWPAAFAGLLVDRFAGVDERDWSSVFLLGVPISEPAIFTEGLSCSGSVSRPGATVE